MSKPNVPGKPKFDWPQDADQGKADRRFLRFPELGAAGNDGASQASDAETRRTVVRDFMRAILQAPSGLAAQRAKLEVNQRVLSTSGSAGGYLIPPGFVPELVVDAPKDSALYQFVRKIPVSQNTGTMPRATTNASVSWGSENTDIEQGDPAFGETSYSLHRLNSLVKLSKEAADDSDPNLVDAVAEMLQQAIIAERDRVIAIGDGTTRPLGIYSASGITNVSVTSLTYANLVELKNSVDPRYWSDPSFRWVFNPTVFGAILKVVDTTGQPIFRESAIRGEPPTILGVPFSLSSASPNNFIFVGALRYYVWFHRGELAMEKTDQGDAFTKHQVWLRIVERVDGRPVLPVDSVMARTRVLAGIS